MSQTILKKKPKSARSRALERAKKKGLKGLNKPQRLNDNSGKSHHVMAFEGKKAKYIKFGQKELRQTKLPDKERLSNLAMLRISSVVKCLPLIGLIK